MGLFSKKEKTQEELDREYCRQMDIPYKTLDEKMEEMGDISYGYGNKRWGHKDPTDPD